MNATVISEQPKTKNGEQKQKVPSIETDGFYAENI
jgi:hypothetical protein